MLKKPNVILLTIDTLRADMLSCYGYGEPISPNIDRLAERGIRFEQAITGGSWTQAAFPVLMTSTYASMYGGCLGPLSPDRPSPIEVLSENGYATVAFTSAPLLSRLYGYQRGFQEFFDLVPGESDPWLRRVKGGEHLLRMPITHSISRILDIRTRPAQLYVSAEELNNTAIYWLKTARTPFFAWIHYMDVHWPYHREEILNQPNEIAQAWRDLAHLHGVNWNGLPIDPQQRVHYLELYKQAVRYTDQQVGYLLNSLEESGLSSDTLIVLVSDHGEEFLERGKWGHFETNLYDEILKVPLIIKLPGQSQGLIVDRQVRTLDIMPTILEMCASKWPPGMEGVNLMPLWSGEGDLPPESQVSISEMWRDHRHIVAVRTNEFKYLWDSQEPDHPELYDLVADPGENHNVIRHYPKKQEFFREKLEAHLRRTAETTGKTIIAEPDLEADMIRRLRDLGYVE